MGYPASKVVALAKAERGYLEKKSNSSLDHPTRNAGKGNWTKYARDDYEAGLFGGKNKNGYAWCTTFVAWCHLMAAGKDKDEAERVSCMTGSYAASCTWWIRYFKEQERFYQSPKIGDSIFFANAKGDPNHTGIVYHIDKKYVYTIEGNTSGASGVVDNGGAVCAKQYRLDYNRILGYGRPDYEEEDMVEISLPILKKGMKGDTVKCVQRQLRTMGYDLGDKPIDGSYGTKTQAAVKAYQKKKGLSVNGNCDEATWKALTGV